jgi:hypothetical protein
MKQDIRRTRKASEVRPVLDEIAALSGQAGSGFIVDAAARDLGTALKEVRSQPIPEGARVKWRD